MGPEIFCFCFFLLRLTPASALATPPLQTSSKRGLIDIDTTAPADTATMLLNSQINWYYNYKPLPSPGRNASQLTFVPMLFSAGPTYTQVSADTTFLAAMEGLLAQGPVPFVLSYNEPDGTTDTGGSNVTPDAAAAVWKEQLEPLRARGVRLGAPAVTGSPRGFTWLQNFFAACAGGCTPDFMPVHWYGDFDGMQANMEQKRATWPDLPLWVTEYALPNNPAEATQAFFSQSLTYFDSLEYVARYSYFGSFRASLSNVGPNVAMLDDAGQLTPIGRAYTSDTPAPSTQVKRSVMSLFDAVKHSDASTPRATPPSPSVLLAVMAVALFLAA